MSIILDNEEFGGGTVEDLTLTWITGYVQVHVNTFPSKRIPGKVAPSTDTDTFVKNPTTYRITARVTDAEKVILETLADEEDKQCKLTDGELSGKNVRPIRVEFANVSGDTDQPWVATIILQGEDH